MKKSEYAKYLQSEHWQSLRKELLDNVTSCERCRLPRWLAAIAYDQDLHVHHRSYANLGNEDWTDLEVLCRYCHEIETFKRSDLKPVKTARCEICGEVHYDVYSRRCRTCERLIWPSSLKSLLENTHADKPLCFDALEAACEILYDHKVKAEGACRFINQQFAKIEEWAKRSKDEVPF